MGWTALDGYDQFAVRRTGGAGADNILNSFYMRGLPCLGRINISVHMVNVGSPPFWSSPSTAVQFILFWIVVRAETAGA
jgi:hypothetical protein